MLKNIELSLKVFHCGLKFRSDFEKSMSFIGFLSEKTFLSIWENLQIQEENPIFAD